MELWQMDVMGRVRLTDGTELSVVTGIDDHSRFCVSAMVVRKATAKPVCAALAQAMRRHGIPDAGLTDNGKVFTGRFGVTKTEVLFDRICREKGSGTCSLLRIRRPRLGRWNGCTRPCGTTSSTRRPATPSPSSKPL
jgi:transposase InsO family protein